MIGDEREVDVSRTPLRKHRLTLALVRYHSIFAINSVAVAVLARRDEWVKGETRLVGLPVNEDVGVFTNDIVDVVSGRQMIGLHIPSAQGRPVGKSKKKIQSGRSQQIHKLST